VGIDESSQGVGLELHIRIDDASQSSEEVVRVVVVFDMETLRIKIVDVGFQMHHFEVVRV